MAAFSKVEYGDRSVEPEAKVFIEHVHNHFQQFDQMKASPAEFLTYENEKQHMRNAVQPNLNLRQLATLDDTLLHKDPTKVCDFPTYLQRIRSAADNYDVS